MRLSQKISIALAIFLLGGVAGLIARAVAPALSAEAQHESRSSLPLTLMGQLRIHVDDYLWLKTDDYLHFGITRGSPSYKSLTKSMIDDFKRGAANTAVQPREERDWRGIFPKLELFHPMKGSHGDPLELLPWYRVQTAINPADTDAYVNAAFFLADCAKKPEEALAFLKEGLAHNPDSLELLESAGRLHYEKWKDYDQAILYLQKAVDLGHQLATRNESQEESLEKSYLFLARAYLQKKMPGEAFRVAEEGLVACPDSALIKSIRRVILTAMSHAGSNHCSEDALQK